MPAAKPKLPEIAPPLPPLTYEPKSRRDPFAPVLLPKDKPGLDVGTLKLVGVMSGRQLMALVETPNGLGYILKPGDGLGNGHVIEISRLAVTFAVAGQRSTRETSVTLRLVGTE
jgi:Tfp pilus assembly protein PilP